MDAVRRRDDDEVEIAGPLPDLPWRVQQRCPGMVAAGARPPLVVTSDDRGELEAVHGCDEWRMEDRSRQAVAEQCDANGGHGRPLYLAGSS